MCLRACVRLRACVSASMHARACPRVEVLEWSLPIDRSVDSSLLASRLVAAPVGQHMQSQSSRPIRYDIPHWLHAAFTHQPKLAKEQFVPVRAMALRS
jgi:hypothetical protein